MATLTQSYESRSLTDCGAKLTNGVDDLALIIEGDIDYQIPQRNKVASLDKGTFRHWVKCEQMEGTATINCEVKQITPSSGNVSLTQAMGDQTAVLKKAVFGADTFDLVITFPVMHGFATAETLTLHDCVTADNFQINETATGASTFSGTLKYFNVSGTAATLP